MRFPSSHSPAFSSAFLSLLLLTAAVSVTAQGPSTPPLLLGPSPGPFIAISAADLDREVAWYRDTLGFALVEQGTVPHRNLRYALLRQGTAFMEILQWPDAKPRSEAAPGTTDPVQIHGFFKSGMVVADVQGLYRRLQALGLTFEYELRELSAGYRSFGVRDPEGNLLQFFGT